MTTSRAALLRRIQRVEAAAQATAAVGGQIVIKWADIVAAGRRPSPHSDAIASAIASGDLDALNLILGDGPPSRGGTWGEIVEAAHASLRQEAAQNAAAHQNIH